MGSWMWKKMLKLREVVRSFYKIAVGNGRHISFWYDRWADRGVLIDILGDRGIIDMGIRRGETVEEAVMNVRKRRMHHAGILNEIEADITELKDKHCPSTEDMSMWRRGSGYKASFSTNETWRLLRVNFTQCSWSRSV